VAVVLSLVVGVGLAWVMLFTIIATHVVTASLLGAIMGAAAADTSGAFRGLIVGAVCWLTLAVLVTLRSMVNLPSEPLVCLGFFLVQAPGYVTALSLALLVYRGIRQTPNTDEGRRQLRILARRSLLPAAGVALLGAYCYSLLADFSESDFNRLATVLPAIPLVMMLATIAWLPRAGPVKQPLSRWDRTAKWMLALAGVLGPGSLAVAYPLVIFGAIDGPHMGPLGLAFFDLGYRSLGGGHALSSGIADRSIARTLARDMDDLG
jgi:hypothetical protein